MTDDGEADLCAYCGRGKVSKRNEEMAFYQWTSRGYVFCRVTIPIGVCNRCGAKNWDDAAEALLEDAVRREFDKLP
jgi:ribosomal protein L37E